MNVIGLADGTFADISALKDAAEGRSELRIAPVNEDPASLGAFDGCSALIVGLHALRAEHFSAMPTSIKVVGRAGIGLDSIDLEASRRQGIVVVHQPDYATDEVATHAVAMLFALSRRITTGDRIARSAWPSWSEFGSIRPLSESRIAVIGLGQIGRTVAERLKPLSGSLVGFDPATSASGIDQAATFEEALSGADVITLHAPLNEHTAGMINSETIDLTAPSALLVNVSRGGLIDEAAVAHALQSGRLGGAALDVLNAEPPSATNPLLDTPNTILTPHMAWLSQSSQARLQHWTMDSVLNVLDHVPVAHGRIAVASA
jgi:D-3-phosphoglycerate dehydrogenase / 2-oxoglutarate reductase